VGDGEGDRFDLRRRHGLRSTHAHQPVSAVGAPQGTEHRRLEAAALSPQLVFDEPVK